jgi:hypothetical protein
MDVDQNEVTGGKNGVNDQRMHAGRQTAHDNDLEGDARRLSSRPRNSHPIVPSKRLSTSTSKKGRSRPPAIADQTPLSQKRVVMDESLNILVVCTFPPFFLNFD